MLIKLIILSSQFYINFKNKYIFHLFILLVTFKRSLSQMKSKKLKQILQQDQEESKSRRNKLQVQQSDKVRVIYPRKRKIIEQQIQTIREVIQANEQQKKQQLKLLSPQRSHSKHSLKKSRMSQNQKQEVHSRRSSKLSNYQPKIIQSSVVERQRQKNPENSRYRQQQQLQRMKQVQSIKRSRVLSQKHNLQQYNYNAQSQARSQYSQSRIRKSKSKNKMLIQMTSKVGIKNDQYFNQQYNQYTQLNGLHQFIRRKQKSIASSKNGRAFTQPSQNTLLQTITETDIVSRKKMGSKSQSHTKTKFDLFVPFNNKFLPQLQMNKSVGSLLKRKIKTQNVSPIANKLLRNDIRDIKEEIFKNTHTSKKSSKRSKSPKLLQRSPSEQRLRQDYKYVIQNDDSDRYNKRKKPLLNQEKKKIKFLKVKQDMLGKIVLERVQNHLKRQVKHQSNYITKVKSEKSIDQALIQFLKMKVNRADKVLS